MIRRPGGGGRQLLCLSLLEAARRWNVAGQEHHPWTAPSEGGEEGPRGWLKDRYGLSWQITPVRLTKLLDDPDQAAAQRVMSAMLQMTRIDIAELERAYAAGA